MQRRNQKRIEICPSPRLEPGLRAQLLDAALRMARGIDYANAGTFEFLVDGNTQAFYFLGANPRLQVEHTVTEELWGVDLVAAQLRIAGGATLSEVGLPAARPRRGFVLQARVNMERLLDDGTPVMEGSALAEFGPPAGRASGSIPAATVVMRRQWPSIPCWPRWWCTARRTPSPERWHGPRVQCGRRPHRRGRPLAHGAAPEPRRRLANA